MATSRRKPVETIIDIKEVRRSTAGVSIIGETGMFQHRFSTKAKRELLLPRLEIDKREDKKMGVLKHDPVKEFREGLYKNRDLNRPAMFHIPSSQLIQAIAHAAMDISGASKAGMLRWIAISEQIDLFGIPFLHMAMCKTGGMSRTADVRTRPFFPEWAASFSISYPTAKLTARSIGSLINAAGSNCGIGDWRQQGVGTAGRFRVVVTADDQAMFKKIVKEQGTNAQKRAYENPEFADEECEELMTWYTGECARRETLPDSMLEIASQDEDELVGV